MAIHPSLEVDPHSGTCCLVDRSSLEDARDGRRRPTLPETTKTRGIYLYPAAQCNQTTAPHPASSVLSMACTATATACSSLLQIPAVCKRAGGSGCGELLPVVVTDAHHRPPTTHSQQSSPDGRRAMARTPQPQPQRSVWALTGTEPAASCSAGRPIRCGAHSGQDFQNRCEVGAGTPYTR